MPNCIEPTPPLDRVVLRSELAVAGAFNCAPDDPRFCDSGPIENHVIVFPRSGVWIRHAGSRAFVADPQVATIYNKGQEYTRARLTSEGDRCDWFAVSPGIALEIASAVDERVFDTPDRPFLSEFTGCDLSLYVRQRRLFLDLERNYVDTLTAEERVVSLVADVIALAQRPSRPSRRGRRAEEAHRDLVERARARIAATPTRNVSLSVLAQELGTSPFHLCRVFRKETGTALHTYRIDLRLRLLLERLVDPTADLSRLAQEYGFASHSHLTATVRARSGFTTSELRRLLAAH